MEEGCALTEKGMVKKVANKYFKTIKDGDEEKWKSLLTPGTLNTLSELKEIPDLPEQFKTFTPEPELNWKIREIELGMNTATVYVDFLNQNEVIEENELELKKVNYEWKVDLEKNIRVVIAAFKGIKIEFPSDK